MHEDQEFERLIGWLKQRSQRLGCVSADARIQVGPETLRFNGFSAGMVVSHDHSGITLTWPRSDVVIYSSFLKGLPVPERGMSACQALVREIAGVLCESEITI